MEGALAGGRMSSAQQRLVKWFEVEGDLDTKERYRMGKYLWSRFGDHRRLSCLSRINEFERKTNHLERLVRPLCLQFRVSRFKIPRTRGIPS
jgi:hypothetical protein